MAGGGEATRGVEVDDLGHRFAGSPFLWRHVSFAVRDGEILALCGRSGCGKSTMLSIIAGWENPTEGVVRRGEPCRISWVFQNPYGAAWRTVLDIAAYPLLAAGHTRSYAEEQARSILDSFGLSALENRLFQELSGGEAQRLMLVRAINAQPDVLLVDEPTAQLDTRTADLVNSTLSQLARSGAAVIIATHDPRTCEACDRVIDLDLYARSE
ncbi:ATP-binding cassette domain-containing protein [Bifidobacterium eulemuris]|uniref:ABC transporter n=1 Tax=Bifidobacterium eulemuris TaxID=1765219 RepID=A0A261GCM8_9BIFI|nr:ATP-binding cassette domain-containing protein [Bifidobacterium eulemuris]OZG69177.1 ABC transporter [Bifidobacterium eulemuris]QOL31310.1 ATP-binding cassette domain-containing protein [Bifidobacterium eulemuris]